jgi:hypothetical protein
MKRGDYHGSRTYGLEEPLSRFTLMLAWIANVARTRFGPQRAAISLFDGESHFTLLGDSERGVKLGSANDPLPAQRSAAGNANDWRVFP